ncbi:MAG: hypothetical protein U9Q30_06940 [Campylobacterota bacterium]|nr:hypothetical protein [Campylobacterota bacterium]
MKIISAGVGAALLLAALLLSYLSSSNADKMIENQNAIVMKYVSDSKEALENEDLKGAKKFAKKAIQADPNNKAGFKAYDEVLKAKYKPLEVNSVVVPTQPSVEDDEEEDEGAMGC